jgi:hypothetical protein
MQETWGESTNSDVHLTPGRAEGEERMGQKRLRLKLYQPKGELWPKKITGQERHLPKKSVASAGNQRPILQAHST